MFSALPEGARPGAVPRSRVVVLLLAVLAAALSLVVPPAGKADAIARPTQTMYTSPSGAPSPGALYARALRLQYSGSSNGAILSVGGTLFYRINRDWMAIGTAFLTRQTLTHNDVDPAMMNKAIPATDPPVNGLMGFARIAYRF